MRLNPHFSADLVAFTKKSLMENFIFCAVLVQRKMKLILDADFY